MSQHENDRRKREKILLSSNKKKWFTKRPNRKSYVGNLTIDNLKIRADSNVSLAKLNHNNSITILYVCNDKQCGQNFSGRLAEIS